MLYPFFHGMMIYLTKSFISSYQYWKHFLKPKMFDHLLNRLFLMTEFYLAKLLQFSAKILLENIDQTLKLITKSKLIFITK